MRLFSLLPPLYCMYTSWRSSSTPWNRRGLSAGGGRGACYGPHPRGTGGDSWRAGKRRSTKPVSLTKEDKGSLSSFLGRPPSLVLETGKSRPRGREPPRSGPLGDLPPPPWLFLAAKPQSYLIRARVDTLFRPREGRTQTQRSPCSASSLEARKKNSPSSSSSFRWSVYPPSPPTHPGQQQQQQQQQPQPPQLSSLQQQLLSSQTPKDEGRNTPDTTREEGGSREEKRREEREKGNK